MANRAIRPGGPSVAISPHPWRKTDHRPPLRQGRRACVMATAPLSGGMISFPLYRLILRLAAPVLALQALGQCLRGRVGAQEAMGDLAERFGFDRAKEGSGRADLWLHGASNGELTSARWLIEGLRQRRPDLHILVTSNSTSARSMVRAWGVEGVSARLAPFDMAGAVARLRHRWGLRALIFVENELWPERLHQMAQQGPVICLGARLSAGSARNWQRLAPRLMRAMLADLALVSAQDGGSEARLLALGLPADRLGPRLMLKSRTEQAQALPPGSAPPFPLHLPRDRILLAASTHEGEEAVILAAFAKARAAASAKGAGFGLLILAPRHPRRSAEVVAALRESGLPFARRSAGETPGPDTAVYLADTLGEMPLWYAMAGATVIGGTFGTAGGHTPWEPAAHGSAILHGPGTANFAEIFAQLQAADAVCPVTADSLAEALTNLPPARQADLAAKASKVLAPADDAALWAALLPLLPPPEASAHARG